MKKIIELIKKLLGGGTKAEKALVLEQLNTEIKAEVEVVKETIEEVKEVVNEVKAKVKKATAKKPVAKTSSKPTAKKK